MVKLCAITMVLLIITACGKKPGSVDTAEERELYKMAAVHDSATAESVWKALNAKSLDYEYRRLYTDARRLAVASLQCAPTDRELAASYFNVGYLSELAGDSPAAITAYRRALLLDNKALEPAHPNTIMTMKCLADLLLATKQYREAEMMYNNLVMTYRSMTGECRNIRSDLGLVLDRYQHSLRQSRGQESAQLLKIEYEAMIEFDPLKPRKVIPTNWFACKDTLFGRAPITW